MLNTEAIIYDYKQKLEEYRETLGILPTDDAKLLANLITNPSSISEMTFAIQCLKFLNHKTNFIQNKSSTLPIEQARIWNENIKEMLSCYIDVNAIKEHIKNLTTAFPKIAQEIQALAQSPELLNALTNPTKTDEALFCQKYRNFLYEQVQITKAKQKYESELAKRQPIIDKLKEDPKYQPLLEILLDPKTETELKFCISFFKLQDNIDTIEQEAKEGKNKPSSTVDIARIVSSNLFSPEEYLNRQTYPKAIADRLYSMVMAEKTDYETLLSLIARNYPSMSPEEVLKAYQQFAKRSQEHIVKDISRNSETFIENVESFYTIQEEFSKLTKTGNFYYPKPKRPTPYSKLPRWVTAPSWTDF